jgi:hypothetical protein
VADGLAALRAAEDEARKALDVAAAAYGAALDAHVTAWWARLTAEGHGARIAVRAPGDPQ